MGNHNPYSDSVRCSTSSLSPGDPAWLAPSDGDWPTWWCCCSSSWNGIAGNELLERGRRSAREQLPQKEFHAAGGARIHPDAPAHQCAFVAWCRSSGGGRMPSPASRGAPRVVRPWQTPRVKTDGSSRFPLPDLPCTLFPLSGQLHLTRASAHLVRRASPADGGLEFHPVSSTDIAGQRATRTDRRQGQKRIRCLTRHSSFSLFLLLSPTSRSSGPPSACAWPYVNPVVKNEGKGLCQAGVNVASS